LELIPSQKPWTYNCRVSSVETKHGLEVHVSVNQDEKEFSLTKSLENPFLLVRNRVSKGISGRWHEERDGIHGWL
jgi:hypothetical protein